jgi:hypothetical protein
MPDMCKHLGECRLPPTCTSAAVLRSVEFETDAGGYSKSATALGYGGVGYKWNQSLRTSLGYRVFYAYYQGPANVGKGSFRFQESLYGPQFNTTFTF